MKGGGGVALYIRNDIGLHSKLLSAKSFVINDILECVTVELSVSKPMSSRKMRVLAHFTIHMVEIIQLYTNQPHTWLGFRHHPSSSVFQPYIWLDTISNSWNNTK